MASSKGYNTRAYTSEAVGAFAIINGSDFGALAGVAPAVAYNAGAGSLAMGTAYVKVTWITASGESLPSAEGNVVISAATGAATVTQPALPTSGATIIGWRVYSAGTTNTEQLNTAPTSTTQVQQPFVTTQGVLTGFAIATTAVQVKIYGTGATVPTVDNSGTQTAFPTVGANTTVSYFAVVPNTGSQWKVQKSVQYMKSDGLADPAGIFLSKIDCIAPAYPGTSQSVSLGAVIVLNGYAFKATSAGTTAATFIGFSAFNLTKGATTTDGTVVWTSFGKAAWLRFIFGNASASTTTAPVAQTYELFEL